jgi:hypothetical protein
MSDTLDQDLAIIGKLIKTEWSEPDRYNGRIAREVLGRRRWFKRCCGQRMFIVHIHSIRGNTLNLHPKSRLRQEIWSNDESICLKCGSRD